MATNAQVASFLSSFAAQRSGGASGGSSGGSSGGGGSSPSYSYSTPFGVGGTAYRDAGGNILYRTNAQGQTFQGGASPSGSGVPMTKVGAYAVDALQAPVVRYNLPEKPNLNNLQDATTPLIGLNATPTDTGSMTPAEQSQQSLQQNQNAGILNRLKEMIAPPPSAQENETQLMQTAQINQQIQQLNDVTRNIGVLNQQYGQKILNNRDRLISTPTMGKAERRLQAEQALEVGALTSAAEAIRGNINMAMAIIDRQQKAYETDINNKQNYQNKLYDAVIHEVDKADQVRLEQWKMNKTLENEKDLALSKAKSSVLQGYYAGGGKDPNVARIISTATDEAQLAPFFKYSLDVQKQQADIASSRASTAAQYQSIDESKAKIAAAAPSAASSDSMLRVNEINNLLADPNLDSVFGVQGLWSTMIPGSAAQLAKAKVQQVIDQAALAARGQLKGQGQVSDMETTMLKNAVAALKTQLSPAQARQELINVRGAITTSSGGRAAVVVTDKNGNAKVGLINQAEMLDAIKNGYTVKYQ